MLKLFKKKDKVQKNINQIEVVIQQERGEGLSVVGRYMAELQQKNNSYFLYSKDGKLKTDLDFQKNETITDLKKKLELLNLSKEEQIKKCEEIIKEREQEIASIKDGKIGDQIVNVWTKKEIVNRYKVLKENLQNGSSGVYEIRNEDGYAQITFLKKHGLLFPVKHNFLKNTTHPENALKQDVALNEQKLLDFEVKTSLKSLLGTTFYKILAIVWIVSIVSVLLLGGSLLQKHQEFNEFMDDSKMMELATLNEQANVRYWKAWASIVGEYVNETEREEAKNIYNPSTLINNIIPLE